MTRRLRARDPETESKVFKNVNSETEIAFDSDVVHISGNETISGYKTFSNELYVGDASNNNVRITSGDIRKMEDAEVTVYSFPENSGRLALESDTRYSFISPQPDSENTVNLQDKAINAVEINSSATFVFPQKVQGKARDFFVRLTITSTEIPTLVFQEPDGSDVSFDVADDSWAEIEPGVNLLMFTETLQ